MPYLTKAEVAYLTLQESKAEVVSPSLLVSNVGQAATGVVASLLTGAAGNTLDSLRDFIRSYLGRNLATAEAFSGISLDSIPDNIENLLDQDYNNIIDLLKAGIGQGVGSIHASLYESLNGVNALVQGYVGLIERVGIDPYIARYVNTRVHPNWFSTEAAWFLRRIGKMNTDDFHKYAEADGWESGRADLFGESLYSPPSIGLMYEMTRRGKMTTAVFKKWLKYFRLDDSVLDGITSLVQQYPEPYRAADMYAKDYITKSKMHEAFKAYGLNSTWADIFSSTQYNVPAISILFELLWRGLISESVFTDMLKKSAIHPSVRSKITSLKEQIPPAADIITMVVREAFEEANIIEAPTEFAEWIAKKGYGKYWADKYWTAHFRPLPLDQAYDNLRRGLWDEAKFKDVLRIADIHPRWHDDILAVAYNPPSIREMGYGYDTGNYTKDDIIRYRRWGGLSPTDAEKAATSLIDYRLNAERNSLRSLYLQQFVSGQLSEAKFKEALTELRTNEAAIELWVQRGTILKAIEVYEASNPQEKSLSLSDIVWLYENGKIDKGELAKRIKAFGYSDEDGKLLLDKIDKEFNIKTAEEAKINIKKLTLSQLNTFYHSGLLSKQNLQARIELLGYTEDDAKDLTTIMIADISATNKALSLSQIANSFYEGLIGEPELRERLSNIGYTAPDVNLLIELINSSVPTVRAPPKLTLSDIRQLYEFGYYDEKELLQVYTDRGYSERDANLKTYLTMLQIKIPMLTTQYRKGWINANELYTAIGNLSIPFKVIGIPEKRLQEIMMTIVKNTQAERVVKERDLTKSEILKGAKNNLLTPAQAVELLSDIGYDTNEANYLLTLNGVIAVGDPKNYYHMKQATQAFKKIQNPELSLIPNELVELEEARKQLAGKIKELKGQTGSEQEVGTLLVELANTEAGIATIKGKLKIK